MIARNAEITRRVHETRTRVPLRDHESVPRRQAHAYVALWFWAKTPKINFADDFR
jgi:hypothetical protein